MKLTKKRNLLLISYIMGFIPKDYVWVHTRIEKYHSEHTEWMNINTEFKLEWNVAIFKATIISKKWTFTWSSFWELWKEKAFEKLETVAVGRALAFAWYEVKDWIASKEEIEEWDKKKPKYFNYSDLLATVESWATTGEAIKLIIKEDWFTTSKNSVLAIKHYLETWEVVENLFYDKK